MNILVTGATGNIGRHIVAQLAEQGENVRALTRNPDAAVLPAGVTAFAGDLTDAASLGEAMAGCESVHFITFDAASGAPLQNGRELVELARRSGVKRVSVLGGWQESTLEPALRESDLAWTLLAPVEFMANALQWAPQVAGEGVVRTMADFPSAMVHEADIAGAAVAVLTQDGHHGQTYYLTGPEALRPADRVARISAALGREVRWVHLTEQEERAQLQAFGVPDEFIEFGVALAKNPPAIGQHVQDTVTRLTGRPGRTFAQWAQEHADAFRG